MKFSKKDKALSINDFEAKVYYVYLTLQSGFGAKVYFVFIIHLFVKTGWTKRLISIILTWSKYLSGVVNGFLHLLSIDCVSKHEQPEYLQDATE